MATLADRVLMCQRQGMKVEEIMETCGATKAFVLQTIGEVPKPGNRMIWDDDTCKRWNYWRKRALMAVNAGYTLYGRRI